MDGSRSEAMSDRTSQLLGAQAMNLDVIDVSHLLDLKRVLMTSKILE